MAKKNNPPRIKGSKTDQSANLGFESNGKTSKRGLAPTESSSKVPVPLLRDRQGDTLFIDARKMGTLIDRVHRELTDADFQRLADTYHAWQGRSALNSQPSNLDSHTDIPGFCKSANLSEIAEHGHVLTSGRYLGAEKVEDDAEPFEEKMARLTDSLPINSSSLPSWKRRSSPT